METLTTASGRRIAYRLQGAGPLLICHGGGPGFSSLYLGDLAGLDESFTLALLDPRGTGGSDRPAEARAYFIEDYVSDLEELRLHLEQERIRLLGHSHGGVVAMAYAAAHPQAVERLVLASTLARFHLEQEEAMRKGMEARSAESWFPEAVTALEKELAGEFRNDKDMAELVFKELPLYFARYGDHERAWLEGLRGDRLNADTLLLFNKEIFSSFDLRPQLPRISAPTLVITGQEDFITGPVCAKEIAAGILDTRLVLIPGAGHIAFIEQPERFRAEVTGFLNG